MVSWNVNEDQKTFIGKWLFDENPNGVIDGNPLNRTNQSITLTLRTNEPVETPAGWTPVGNSETEFTKIVDQNSTISVQVQDKVGNSSANITLTVSKIDKKEPINLTLETEGNVSLIKDAEVKINFSAEDDLSGIKEYQCKTQNGNWEVCSNPFVIRNLVEGVNTISMKAIDNAGNVSETSIQVTSDRTPPVISLQAGDLVLVHNVDPYVFANATCQDNIDATCSVTYGPSDVPTQIQNLANTALSGAVVFEEIYTATDKAGNKSEIKRKITLIPADYPVLSLSGASVVTQEL